MPMRNCYYDTATGKEDQYIRHLLNGSQHDGKAKILLNIIKNDLTARQNEIFVLYYFKSLSMPEIAKICNVSNQAVSAIISRARKRIFRYMKYYFQ